MYMEHKKKKKIIANHPLYTHAHTPIKSQANSYDFISHSGKKNENQLS